MSKTEEKIGKKRNNESFEQMNKAFMEEMKNYNTMTKEEKELAAIHAMELLGADKTSGGAINDCIKKTTRGYIHHTDTMEDLRSICKEAILANLGRYVPAPGQMPTTFFYYQMQRALRENTYSANNVTEHYAKDLDRILNKCFESGFIPEKSREELLKFSPETISNITGIALTTVKECFHIASVSVSSVEALGDAIKEKPDENFGNPEDLFLKNETSKVLGDALNKLSKGDRYIIQRLFLDDTQKIKYKDLAEEINSMPNRLELFGTLNVTPDYIKSREEDAIFRLRVNPSIGLQIRSYDETELQFVDDYEQCSSDDIENAFLHGLINL